MSYLILCLQCYLNSRTVALRVWSLKQQHYPLSGDIDTQILRSPSQTYWIINSGGGVPSTLFFNQPYEWFWSTLKIENHSSRCSKNVCLLLNEKVLPRTFCEKSSLASSVDCVCIGHLFAQKQTPCRVRLWCTEELEPWPYIKALPLQSL